MFSPAQQSPSHAFFTQPNTTVSVVSRPTRWSLWHWYLDVYVDHLYYLLFYDKLSPPCSFQGARGDKCTIYSRLFQLDSARCVTIFIWSQKQFCLAGTESAKYKVAVLVLSAPKNREKRQNIRKLQLPGCHLQVFSNRSIKQMGDNFTITAWKSFDICVGWPLFVQFLFLIGQTGNSSLEEILHKVLINLTNHPMITLWSF